MSYVIVVSLSYLGKVFQFQDWIVGFQDWLLVTILTPDLCYLPVEKHHFWNFLTANFIHEYFLF